MIARSFIAAFGQSPPVVAGWVQRASDNFSGTNGADLTTGGNWTSKTGSIIYDTPNNAARNNSNSVIEAYEYSGVSFGANQYSQCTLKLSGQGGGTVCGVNCRWQAGAISGYMLHYEIDTLYLGRYDAGTFNNLASVARTYSNGNKLRLEVEGTGAATRLTGYEDTGSGWSAVWTSFNPSTYYDGGKPGIWGFHTYANLEVSAWSAGDE